MKKYEDHIVYQQASHIHRGKFTAPISSQVKDLNLKTVISPAISTIYNNNPAYTSIRL